MKDLKSFAAKEEKESLMVLITRLSLPQESIDELVDEFYKAGWKEFYTALVVFHTSEEVEVPKEMEGSANTSRYEKGGSRTARYASWMRFFGHALGFGPDYLAVEFLEPKSKPASIKHLEKDQKRFKTTGFILGATEAQKAEAYGKNSWNVMSDPIVFLHSRTCFIEDVICHFAEVYEKCNIVILGAGLDTRFYRIPFSSSANLFEVDTKPSQEAKLAEIGEKVKGKYDLANSKITYVPCDFETESWFDVLKANGLDSSLPTVIAWEGVTYYLTREVVEETLALVATKFDGLAAIAFDYFTPTLCDSFRTEGDKEPLICGFEAEGIEKLVTAKGLHLADHLSCEDCSGRYLPQREDGSSIGIPSPQKCFVMATNKKIQ